MYNSLQKLGLKRKKPLQIIIATTIYWLKYDKNLQIITQTNVFLIWRWNNDIETWVILKENNFDEHPFGLR